MAKGRNNVTILKVACASKHGFADERRLRGEILFYLRYQRLANASYPLLSSVDCLKIGMR